MTAPRVFLLFLLLTLVEGNNSEEVVARVVSIVPAVADTLLNVLYSSVEFLQTFLVNIYTVMWSYDSFDQLVGSIFFWVAGITKHIFLETLIP